MCLIFLLIINKTIDISDITDIDKHLMKKMIYIIKEAFISI